MKTFVDTRRDRFGVEPICRALQIAHRATAAAWPSSATRPCAVPRARRDAELLPQVQRVLAENLQVYGAEKIWRQLAREGQHTPCWRVERLMRGQGLYGVVRGMYKAELIHRRGSWKAREAVEIATLDWVSWFNHSRVLEPLG